MKIAEKKTQLSLVMIKMDHSRKRIISFKLSLFDFTHNVKYDLRAGMSWTVTGEQQIGSTKLEIGNCGANMLRPSSSSQQKMADV